MKYIVRKEMPFCNVGQVYEADSAGQLEIRTLHEPVRIGRLHVQIMARDGWLEELPEKKSLWDKLLSDYYIDGRSSAYWLKEIAPKISEQHFREEGWVKKGDVVKEIERWKCNVRMTSNDLIQKIKEM